MSQESPLIKIKNIDPSQTNFSLIFEVDQILSKKQNQSKLTCRIVDDTGIVEAFFTDFIQQFKIGDTYEIKRLTAKVVDNHIRVELGDKYKLHILPESDSFKITNKKNNISEKYYVSKKQLKELTQEQSKEAQRKQKSNKFQKPTKSEIKPQKFIEKQEKLAYNQDNAPKKLKYNQKYPDNFYIPKQNNFQKNSDNGLYKPKYNQKPSNNSHTHNKNSNKNRKDFQAPTIKLNKIHRFNKQLVSVVVWIAKNKRQLYSDYWMGYVSDQTGGLWMEFDKTTHIEGDDWYSLKNVEVQTDDRQGFILFEQKNTEIKSWMGQIGSHNMKPIKFDRR